MGKRSLTRMLDLTTLYYMDDTLEKLASKRLSREIPKNAVDAMTSFIANNPGAQHEDLVRRAMEMGYNPASLIEQSLGSVMVDKNGLNLNLPLEDLLNESYGEKQLPGARYVINPNDISSSRGKEVLADLAKSRGVSVSKGAIPDYVAVKDATTELEKLRALPIGGHELQHTEDLIRRPKFVPEGALGEVGHHLGPGTFESKELIKQVRDLPDDPRIAKEILKRTGGKAASVFSKLRGAVPFIGPALGLGAAAYSRDSSAAIPILSEAEPLGPERGSEDYAIENPQITTEARRAVLEQLKRPRKP